MSTSVIVQDSFLACAYELPKDVTKKVFRALRILLTNPSSGGLQIEKLHGKSKGLWSARVDSDYRIIFDWYKAGVPVVIYVAKHDDAYEFSKREPRAAGGIVGSGVAALAGASLLNRAAVIGVAEAIIGRALPSPKAAQVSSEIDQLEPLVNTRKYLPLARALLNSKSDRVAFDFSEIERIIQVPLPASARRYPAWWANESSGSHVQAFAWLGVGWKVEKLTREAKRVEFRRQS